MEIKERKVFTRTIKVKDDIEVGFQIELEGSGLVSFSIFDNGYISTEKVFTTDDVKLLSGLRYFLNDFFEEVKKHVPVEKTT